jgi:hypothetical protein
LHVIDKGSHGTILQLTPHVLKKSGGFFVEDKIIKKSGASEEGTNGFD